MVGIVPEAAEHRMSMRAATVQRRQRRLNWLLHVDAIDSSKGDLLSTSGEVGAKDGAYGLIYCCQSGRLFVNVAQDVHG